MTKADIEATHFKLIDLVRAESSLWDKDDPEYRNNDGKQSIWARVSEQLGLPMKTCQTKWKGLRDGYLKHLTTLMLPKDATAPHLSGYITFRYAPAMTFLDNQLSVNNTKTPESRAELLKQLAMAVGEQVDYDLELQTNNLSTDNFTFETSEAVFARHIAMELEQMTPDARNACKTNIEKILFSAKYPFLNQNSTATVGGEANFESISGRSSAATNPARNGE